MKKLLLISLLLSSLLLYSCDENVKKEYYPKSIVGTTIVMDSTFDQEPYQAAVDVLNKYKPAVAKITDSIIGYNNQLLAKHTNNALIGDFISDVMIVEAERVFDTNVDISIINNGGIRSDLPEGEITLGNVFNISPFDNNLVLIKLKGKEIKDMFNTFTKDRKPSFGGATLRMYSEHNNSLYIGGQPVNDNKEYVTATIDFLLDGGDGFFDQNLVKDENTKYSSFLLRDALANYILNNSPIQYKSDNRLVIKY
ncbi:MAG: 5'-nucleotidase C-terminal domain-containing protein [Bacteroidales bacterium]